MIAFGVCVGSRGVFEMTTRPALERVMEEDSEIYSVEDATSIFEAYNEVLELVARRSDLEALVLLHDVAEIVDPQFCAKVRRTVAGDGLKVAGPIGSIGASSIDWWRTGRVVGALPDGEGQPNGQGGTGRVDSLDGVLMILSASVVREFRYDTSAYRRFHGYDAEICSWVRSRGGVIAVLDVSVVHHSKGGRGDIVAWRRANFTWKSRWRSHSGLRKVVLSLRARCQEQEVWLAQRAVSLRHRASTALRTRRSR